MSEFFLSGRAVDLILLMMLAEGVLVAVHHRRTGRGFAPADLKAILMSGAGLLLALRCALTGAWWGWIALSLLVALAAHLGDLRRRWRRGPSGSSSV